MAETEQNPHAVRFYERTRDEVAERRVADEAEAVVAAVWIAELEEMRIGMLGLIAAASVAEHLAMDRLRQAQSAGRPGDLARAHARLVALQADRAISLEDTRAVVARVDAELELAARAGAERSRRVQQDLQRLRAAWTGAYGDGPSHRAGS
ncbi:MAG TPA: hypothetical protein VH372_19240 [Actinospica sp.]|jgi:hypothetical protein|nr:hypothetical protein [Actinospica sp.]